MTEKPLRCRECHAPATVTLGALNLCSRCAADLAKQQKKETLDRVAAWRESLRVTK